MPNATERAFRYIAFLTLVVVASGCATAPESGPEEAPANSGLLRQVASRLPGVYVSLSGDDQPVQQLRVEQAGGGEPGTLTLRLVQGGSTEQAKRTFGLRLTPTSMAARLDGELALLDASGATRRSCPMRFQAGGEGLIGETDPSTCRFGEGQEAVGLLKEIAFDGRRLVIGDRLVDPADGETRGDDQVITFLPAPAFEGWAGVRDGDRWRVAEPFRTAPGNEASAPVDAAGMPLGFSVALNYYRYAREDEAILLRLTLSDSTSGKILGEAWAEPGSETIGLALPEIQVGISRNGAPQ